MTIITHGLVAATAAYLLTDGLGSFAATPVGPPVPTFFAPTATDSTLVVSATAADA